jgi:probable HAF family extracellular repeat protein
VNRLRPVLLLALTSAGTLTACSDTAPPTAPSASRASASVLASRDHDGTSRDHDGSGIGRFTTIDPPQATDAAALAINDRGTIVGRYADANGRTHGFLRTPRGEFTTIDFPRASFTVAAAINNRGAISGMYSLPTAPTVRHGFLLTNGSLRTFDPPGSSFTNALGINDGNDVVGRFCTLFIGKCRPPGDVHVRGFLFRDGSFTIFEVPGSVETDAFAINNRGQIVGAYQTADRQTQLFVLREGEFTTIALPDGVPVSLDKGGINDRGDIVGAYCDGAPPCDVLPTGTHGFLMSDRRFRTIDFPGASATAAFGINNRGQIVGGYFVHGMNVAHAYLLHDLVQQDAVDEAAHADANGDAGALGGRGERRGWEGGHRGLR